MTAYEPEQNNTLSLGIGFQITLNHNLNLHLE